MLHRRFAVLSLAAALVAGGVSAAALPPHPRLFADDARFAGVKAFCGTNAFGRAFMKKIVADADAILAAAPVTRKLEPGGKRLLQTSWLAQARLLRLAAAWRFTGDRRYLARGLAELDALSAFSDWHASHFLDVAEIDLGFAVAYDWFFPALTPEQRARYAAVLVDKGIRPGMRGNPWWSKGNNNWNEVCNAGLVAAAYAIADADPALADQVVDRAIKGLPNVLATYAPDGAYPEGPVYWTYGTDFGSIALEVIKEMRGDDKGLSEMPGLSETCYFPDRMTGPTGACHNYSDASAGIGSTFARWWLAARYHHPDCLAHERVLAAAWAARPGEAGYGARLMPLVLPWLDQPVAGHDLPDREPYAWTSGGPVPLFVTGLACGAWLSVKGGSPSTNHAHMDAGSFVYELSGGGSAARFVIDLGKEDYAKIETSGVDLWNMKQTSGRWSVLRVGPDSHAIPRLDGARQAVKGAARFATVTTNGDTRTIVLDMTTLYPAAKRATRAFAIAGRTGVLTVTDHFEGLTNGTRVVAQYPVPGVRMDAGGKTGTLLAPRVPARKGGKPYECGFAAPGADAVTVADCEKLRKSYERPVNGLKRIDVEKTAGASGAVDLAVTFTPPAR